MSTGNGKTGKILIVDDDGDLRGVLGDVLREEGFAVTESMDGDSAMNVLKAPLPDAVLLDLKMPGRNGLEVMGDIHRVDQRIPVIIMTAYGDIPTAVEAIKKGAYDFTIKPPDIDKLLLTLRRAVERRRIELEMDRFHTALNLSLEQVFGKSPGIQSVIGQIVQVAQTNLSVIIQGETGTGKSFIANAIHSVSKRGRSPFVRVDMGLIPDSLFESELFGYKKGAFTGADRNKAGYFENAHQGTLFIDEIENVPLHLQGKLLSIIDERRLYPLGSTTPVAIDVRILAATNRDIKQCVSQRTFREDLYYRLGEFVITLPPLRERTDDIPFFAQKFALDSSTELNKQIREITDGALDVLVHYGWPGNVRELKNVLRKAVLMTDNGIIDRAVVEPLLSDRSADQPADPEAGTFSLKEAVRSLERKKIREVMQFTRGNKVRAAALLEISYKNLHDKIKIYGIE